MGFFRIFITLHSNILQPNNSFKIKNENMLNENISSHKDKICKFQEKNKTDAFEIIFCFLKDVEK